jgi:hypothetical protein
MVWNPKWNINNVIPLPPRSQKLKKMISTENIEFFSPLLPHLKEEAQRKQISS